MPLESVTQRINGTALDSITKRNLRAVLIAMLDRIRALEAKLNIDAGVTDVDYGVAAALATLTD